MRVFGLEIPNSVSSVRFLELSKAAKHRLRIMEWCEAHGKNARLTCRHFGISPDTFYRWKRRFDGGGPVALENASRRPRRVRKPTWSPELERAVLELRNLTPGWGKDKLVVLLRQENWRCSTSMVGRILRELKESWKLVEAPVRDPWQ
jgi:transposase